LLGKERVDREQIFKAALRLIDSEGPEGFSMRGVARLLGINPMTLYHHVGDRDRLLRELSDRVYREVGTRAEKGSRSARKQLETLLSAYYEAVLRHPQLSLSIFSSPEAFSKEARRITVRVLELLEAAGLPKAKSQVWLAILVDFTHGSALATAMSAPKKRRSSSKNTENSGFFLGLSELLNSLPQASTAQVRRRPEAQFRA
jgi:AcrR family transcriptional regulator